MGARGLVMAVAAEWLLLKLAAERIGAARLSRLGATGRFAAFRRRSFER
jgi:hypothetical protein